MDGLVDCHRRMRTDAALPPIVHAACIGFPTVYIHPFADGNGRAHRFLLHNILAQREYLPPNTVFPLSAWLLRNRKSCTGSMTRTCNGILDMAQLHWEDDSSLKVVNDIAPHFRYMDLTQETASLYRFIRATVHDELEPGIEFMISFEEAIRRMNDVVDWPYPQQSLFIKLCVQNKGRLSKRKRALPAFRDLQEDVLSRLESCVQQAYRLNGEHERTSAL